ncbi:MAG TPA: hypothetical protein VG123_01360 [Streptosporangiaceae bacterium]|nr:hypothetical protein [Streptosporangiaceae bacterium]
MTMSGSMAADIVVPVVALLALLVLIGPVMWASRDPSGKGSGQRSRRAVSGGTFRGDPRQQMPHRDAGPPEALAREGQNAGGDRPAG